MSGGILYKTTNMINKVKSFSRKQNSQKEQIYPEQSHRSQQIVQANLFVIKTFSPPELDKASYLRQLYWILYVIQGIF